MVEELVHPNLSCVISADSISTVLILSKRIIEENSSQPLSRWAIPSDAPMSKKEFNLALERIAEDDKSSTPVVNIEMEFGTGVLATVYTRTREGKGLYSLRLRPGVDPQEAEKIIAFQELALNITRALYKESALIDVELIPDHGVLAIPDVPIAHVNSRIVLTSEEEVAEAYEDPSVFWEAGWDVIEELNNKMLLARGLDVSSGPGYLERIIPYQWEMARAAKPGLTEYFFPQLSPGEEEVYRSGMARLETVGYVAPQNVVELSCVLDPGEHIQGWEIFDLWYLIEEGQLPDGRQVDLVRVVFLDRWAAEQEKRPLLDIGAKIFHYDDSGELVEVTD